MLQSLARKRILKKRKVWQSIFQYVGGFCLLFSIGWISTGRGLDGFFERKSHDWFHLLEWFPIKQHDIVKKQFLIIYIDDQSHDELEQPYDRAWSRHLHAELLEKINATKPKLVFYDVIFDQKSSDPSADQRFAKAIEENGNVILGASFMRIYNRDNGEPEERLSPPLSDFRRVAADWGIIVNAHDSADNGIRRFEKAYFDDRIAPAYWAAAEHTDPDSTQRAGSFTQPRWIRYIAPPPSIPATSFSTAILSENLDFSDKYIFIGARHSVGMPGAGRDVFRSPYLGASEGEYPGVDIHATFFYNIISETWLNPLGKGLNLAIICIAALLLTVFVNPFGPIGSLISSFIIAVSIAGSSIWLIENERVFFAWLIPVIVQTPSAFLFSNICNYFFLARKRKQLKRTFSSYLSPVMVQRITEAEEEPQLGGKEEVITPFFSDVVGYSELSEKLSPIELTQFMNEYLGAMTDIIQDEHGTLDKYIGDAIVAFFGAPLPMTNHAYHACRAAARMQRTQLELCREWSSSGRWPELAQSMRTRIGLNSGRAVVGNMGSTVRFNYSMSGDVVNLAARCESGAKHFGVYTMVTEDSYESATTEEDHKLVFRRLNRCTVAGRKKPVMLYELIDEEGNLTDREIEGAALYEEALDRYFQQDWNAAEKCLLKAIEMERWQPGKDPKAKTNPSLLLLELCRQHMASPPGNDWDGIYHLTSK